MALDEDNEDTPNTDRCPAWADDLIRQIYMLEVRLGNIRAGDDWESEDMERLYQKVYGDTADQAADEESVENLFRRVADGLSHEGFDPAEIAAFINARVIDVSRLPYCNEREVQEAVRSRLH